jgi:hypothetical protein
VFFDNQEVLGELSEETLRQSGEAVRERVIGALMLQSSMAGRQCSCEEVKQ